jgi:hypothetical protein
LILGGRFGGKYRVDPTKSITNAEYEAAKEAGIPVFTFVKQDVLNDHNLWQRNKEKKFAEEIEYPSIDKQEHALDIFKFIDAVRLAPVNNGFFGFRLAKDIHDALRKQWAGMVWEYLQNRTIAHQISLTNAAVGNLTVVSNKIEELVKSIYTSVDAQGAPGAIETIDMESKAEEFFVYVAQKVSDRKFVSEIKLETNKFSIPASWVEFLTECCYFEIKETTSDEGIASKILVYAGVKTTVKVTGPRSKAEEEEMQTLSESYGALLKISVNAQRKLLGKYLWTAEDSVQFSKQFAVGEKTRGNDS